MGTLAPGAALAGGGAGPFGWRPWESGQAQGWQSPGSSGRQPIEAGQTAPSTVVTGSVVLAGSGHTCGEAWLWPDEQAPELPTNNLQSKEKKRQNTKNKSPDTPMRSGCLFPDWLIKSFNL